MDLEQQVGAPESGNPESEIRRQKTIGTKEKPKKIVSRRKIEANRRNALRSTGPRSKRGKKFSSWNSLDHGLLAREIVIPAGLGRENAGEFLFLLEQLRRDLCPDGALEEILVEKIAACYWRLRRLLHSETGELLKGFGHIPRDIVQELTVRELLGLKEPMTGEERDNWIETEEARRHLPGSGVVDKILRYETTLERELYRALHQLERIQRRKKGENVPPPIAVEFSGG